MDLTETASVKAPAPPLVVENKKVLYFVFPLFVLSLFLSPLSLFLSMFICIYMYIYIFHSLRDAH